MKSLPIALALILCYSLPAISQPRSPSEPRTPKPLLVDEFASLDDKQRKASISDEKVTQRIELARAHYLKGLKHVGAGDSKKAAWFFDGAMEILNDLINHPDIDAFPEYAQLSRSVVRDYEETITSVDDLDSTSSFFVLRDKMFQEIELLPVSYRPAESPEPELVVPEVLQIELTDHAAVAQTLDYFTNGRGRKYMAKWLARSGRFFPMYERILAEEGAPDELKYLSMIESGLNPTVTSHAHAVGLWQFIASTGRAYGMHADWYRDERRDPEKATRAAARYLLDLYDEMGDWHLALGSYNCGPGRMRRALRRADSTDYWSARQHLPRETRRYVPLYIAAAKIARDPAAYGFTEIPFERPDQFEVVAVYAPHQLSTIASAAGCSVDDLKRLNPELLRSQVPPGESVYDLRVPVGLADPLTRKLDTLALAAPEVSVIRHKVKKGETVTKIARKYGASVSDVLAANNMTARSTLLRGATLEIPTNKSTGAKRIAARNLRGDTSTTTGVVASADSPGSATGSSLSVAPTSGNNATSTSATKRPKPKSDVEALVAEVPTAERKEAQTGLDDVDTSPENETTVPTVLTSEPTIEHKAEVIAETVIPVEESLATGTTEAAVHEPTDTDRVEATAVSTPEIAEDSAPPSKVSPATTVASSGNQVTPHGAETTTAAIPDPVVTAADVARVPAEQPTAQTPVGIRHRVMRGETLSGIAARYGVSMKAVASANPKGVTRNNDVLLGSTLTIGTSKSSGTTATEVPTTGTAKSAIAPTRSNASTLAQTTQVRRYKIRRGETIGDIADRFDVTIVDLQRYNPRLDPRSIRPGQVIRVR